MSKVTAICIACLLFAGTVLRSDAAISADELRGGESLVEKHRDLIDTAANHLMGNLPALDSFFAKLLRQEHAGNQRVSIVHVGDSHLQADYLSEVVREALQRRFGNGGRGFVAPFKLAGTNAPRDYAIRSDTPWKSAKCTQNAPICEVGIGGVALTTQSDRIDFRLESPGSPFDRVTVFHHRDAPLLLPEADLACEISCPQELTPEYTVIPLNRSTETLTLTGNGADTLYNNPAFYGFSLENGETGVLYHVVGLNGTAYAHVNRYPQMVTQLAPLQPDLIVVSLGTNDLFGRNFTAVELRTQVEGVIRALKENCPGSALLLTTPMECYNRRVVKGRAQYTLNPNAKTAHQIFLEVARSEQIPCWDLYQASGGTGANARWHERKLIRYDRVHASVEGYRLQGEMLRDALFHSYDNYCNP